jgi:hypothetical protein
MINRLEGEGHSEKSICFAIWKAQDKLLKFRQDTRFLSILENEIKKWSWPKGDPRWDKYYEKKAESNKMRGAARGGYIYFVQGKSGGAIKIGYTEFPEAQLQLLQTGYPDILTVLLLMSGSRGDKDKILERFASSRLNGEWFKPDARLLEEIKELSTKT